MTAVIYIIVALSITSVALSAVFFVAWQSMGRQQHALTWSITFAVATVQWASNLAAALFPSWQAYWLTVNALGLVTVSLALLGHCQRGGINIRPVVFWAPPLGCFLLIAWFTVVSPHVGLNVGMLPAYGAIAIAIGGFLIINTTPQVRPAEWGAAIVIFMLAISQAAAASVAFMQGATFDATYSALYSQINFLVMPGAYTASGMFIILVLASDMAEKMKTAAVRDQLTNLLNRRGFVEAAERVFAQARRSGSPLSVVITDIDHFKDVNDRHGHHAGDRALVHFAGILADERRREDVVARIGGEEFAILLPGVVVQDAIEIADSLCKRLAASELQVGTSTLSMSASFGVAVLSINDQGFSEVLDRADAALYRSKRAGRNRIDLEASQVLLTPGGQLRNA